MGNPLRCAGGLLVSVNERMGSEADVDGALARHGYNPDAVPCGLSARPGREGETWMSAGQHQVLLRYRVCVLDGVLIDGHEASDLDPGGGCIHCGKEPDDGDREPLQEVRGSGRVTVRTTFEPWREIEIPEWEADSLRSQGLLAE